ncbi:AraC family transcriptional regulator [Nostoc sp. CHAB 5784]|uniref:AraC family transcriptional regulator N-terminal domain-containing protein n=1 Tax=Nostoc mirabile TaxID=2907820 RepID=UPI001E41D4B7|nr:AraC family transcriptional regulator N-terminal domain-containing protein [Nostoc mirabile]MCC5669679.1 AraC family transcriptional regulator [Nostoc mirabile CHAB5784]
MVSVRNERVVIETLNYEAAISKCDELAALVTRHTDSRGNGVHPTAISQLEFMRESDTSATMQGVAEPILGIVVQGKKEVLLNEETYGYGVAQYLALFYYSHESIINY